MMSNSTDTAVAPHETGLAELRACRARKDDGPAFTAMLAAARAAGAPRQFSSDLIVHDRAAVRRPAGPFAWYLYPAGTHLVRPSGRRLVAAVTENFDCGAWFFWDGTALRPCSAEQAEDLLRDAEESEGCQP